MFLHCRFACERVVLSFLRCSRQYQSCSSSLFDAFVSISISSRVDCKWWSSSSKCSGSLISYALFLGRDSAFKYLSVWLCFLQRLWPWAHSDFFLTRTSRNGIIPFCMLYPRDQMINISSTFFQHFGFRVANSSALSFRRLSYRFLPKLGTWVNSWLLLLFVLKTTLKEKVH